VAKILVAGQRATGVQLQDGTVLEAKWFVASGVDAPQTIRMAGEEHFPAPIPQKMRDFQWAGHSLVTLHLALNEPPRYAAAAFDPAVDQAFDTMIGADNADDLANAFAAIKRRELPNPLVGSSACNTRYDPSMAPPGKHVAFWWPFAPYELGDAGAAGWDDCKAEVTARMLAQWRAYAPNMTESNVLGSYLFTPLDIERFCINMVRGSHHVGAYTLQQFGYTRPCPEMAQYRTPVEGLYLCGASSHPGGAVTGGPGYICAAMVADDMGIDKWWTPMPLPSWEGAPEAELAAASA
jgi:phytoene dehydrogenase-like protein